RKVPVFPSCFQFQLSSRIQPAGFIMFRSFQVSCLFMQSCILPCSLYNGDELILHWSYTKGDLNVHSFYQNQDQLGNQNQRFRNRTSVFKDQIPRNNLSLKLTGVKLQDEGRYKCLRSQIIIVSPAAPVSDIRIHQDGNRITCSSEGIYPQPELTWSTEPPSNTALNETTRIQKTEDQLYDISSSLTGPDGPDLIYSCSIRTRRNQRRATLRRLCKSVINSPTKETKLHVRTSLKQKTKFQDFHFHPNRSSYLRCRTFFFRLQATNQA
uniref:Ig-like domain-containing protein n=1 Tax=Poecilia latipinna TaxID=48699 RepID=A0A3B3V5C4_9TELE